MHDCIAQELIYEVSHNHATTETMGYEQILDMVRSLISQNHASELADSIDQPDAKERVLDLIISYITTRKLHNGEVASVSVLAGRIYEDMVSFGCITQYLEDEKVEEVNCHSWEDIEVITKDGYFKAPVHFSSPLQCQDITKKMVRLGNVILDGTVPVADSFIKQGVRISAAIPPAVPAEAGATFSIRKQSKATITRAELVNAGCTTDEELDFLITCVRHGISVGIAGSTNSGKTTDINFLLRSIGTDLRIYTIEDSFELNLIKRDADGNVMSRVVSTKTRLNGNPQTDITREDLLKFALRNNPDIIVPAEMRGAEARESVEAGRTGHTILTTFHADNALDAYTRILTMYSMSDTRLGEDLLMKNIVKAYPIMVFKAKLRDKSRRYMRIVEALDYSMGELITNTLFEFVVTNNRVEDGKVTVEGYHRKVLPISDNLALRLLEHGAPMEIIQRFARKGWMLEGRKLQ